jgi:hypothetical protein
MNTRILLLLSSLPQSKRVTSNPNQVLLPDRYRGRQA